MKIAILGTSGSGKSTLAKQLGERYGAPVLHLDTVHFLPGWVERTPEEEETILSRFLDEHDSWVIDGNYSGNCYARRLEETDQIIVLWFGRFVCLRRVIKRWWENRGRVRESSAAGCEEKIDLDFIRWVLYEGRSPKKYEKMKALGHQYPDKVVMIESSRQLKKFICTLPQTCRKSPAGEGRNR